MLLGEFTSSSGLAAGSRPVGTLASAGAGVVYGLTTVGGADNCDGCFCYDRASGLRTLVEFTGKTGAAPGAGLADLGGGNFAVGGVVAAGPNLLYGEAPAGGPGGGGVAFRLTLDSAQSPFSQWRQTFAGDAAAPMLADPDADGVPLLMEYALGLLPTVHDAATMPAAGLYPDPSGEVRLRLILTRDPARSDVTITVQAASDPAGPWDPLASSVMGAPFSGTGYPSGDAATPGLKTSEIRDTATSSSTLPGPRPADDATREKQIPFRRIGWPSCVSNELHLPDMKLLAIFSALLASAIPVVAVGRPNIILIMSDDVGYSDLGCYGSEIATPALDALAQGGVRFTQFYNTARCCPTRASLLTGLYAQQAGIGHMVDGPGPKTGSPAYSGELSRNAVTIAEVLKTAGYSTYMAGKWHVTQKIKPDDDKNNWPLQRGFERFYGTIHGAGSLFDPNTLTRDYTYISPVTDVEYQPREFYYTDAINDHAARFVTEHKARNAEQPFFLYVAHTAAHWPMHAKESDIAKYRGKYDAGYDAIRAARLARMKQLGLLDPRWQLSPQAGDWNKVGDKAWEARCMEVYAAMLDCMDQGIGRLVETLKKNGQYENTLVLYLQDNGGCAEGMDRNGPHKPRADAPPLPPLAKDYLQPDMIPKQTRDGFPVRRGKGVMPGAADTYIAYGQSWANVSNTPFREYKHWQHEGGISTPLIAHWPRGIAKKRHGQLEAQPAHLIDLMATCVELGGAKYPAVFAGQKIQPVEGMSLVPALAGQPLARTQPLFWEHEGNRAIRAGDWKLVSKHPGGWELYDMAADRSEMQNLAAQHPERVQELTAQWNAWAQRTGVLPWPLTAKDPANRPAK